MKQISKPELGSESLKLHAGHGVAVARKNRCGKLVDWSSAKSKVPFVEVALV
jgi:hypothetical protein